MEQKDTGVLLNKQDIELQRKYFEEAVKLIGINCVYYAPREGKVYNGYGELENFFYEPILIGCVFNEHPTIWTMKKLGWDSELEENAAIITVPYNLNHLVVGALFVIPSAIDNSEGRVYRVVAMNTSSMIYPSAITCRLVPEYKSSFENQQMNYENSNFNLLKEVD